MKYLFIFLFIIAIGTTVHAQTPPVRTTDPIPAQNAKSTASVAPVRSTDANARTASPAAAAVEAVPVRTADPAPAGSAGTAKKEQPAKEKVLRPSEQAVPAATATKQAPSN